MKHLFGIALLALTAGLMTNISAGYAQDGPAGQVQLTACGVAAQKMDEAQSRFNQAENRANDIRRTGAAESRNPADRAVLAAADATAERVYELFVIAQEKANDACSQ